MPTDGYHGFIFNRQFHLANQMKPPSQVVRGRNGMQAVKPVNNDTIKCEIKWKQMDIASLCCLCVWLRKWLATKPRMKPCSYGKLNCVN